MLAQLPGGLTGEHEFFRAETGTLLQGKFSDPRIPVLAGPRGTCPIAIDETYEASYCNCGCNGPIMEPGMVAWAGGAGGGTNFFIFTGDKGQAEAWKHDHTVWGMLADQESFDTLDAVYKLPSHKSGVTVLTQSVQFQIQLL